MIGGAGGRYRSLFANYSVYYGLLKRLLIDKKALITGIDLDIEEVVSLKDTLKLINDIKSDFPDIQFLCPQFNFHLKLTCLVWEDFVIKIYLEIWFS